MPLYRGFDVLELEPDRGTGTPVETHRKVFVLDSVTGIRSAEAADPSAAEVRGFAWLTFTRTEAKALRDFIDARAGRAVPFWVPAWEEDFTLTADHAPTDTLTVLQMGYTEQMFPAGNVRRHLAIRTLDGTLYYRKVTASVNNGNGTETLTLEEAVPVSMPMSGTLIAVLHFARLEDDEVEIEWAGQFAEARMRTRDLPTETPS
jgi:hypothetical protein